VSVLINLLPIDYRRTRRRERRFRVGAVVGAVLVTAEALTGLSLHVRAQQTRELLDASEAARSACAMVKKELVAPQAEATRLEREVALAERLRTKHRWSRLLAAVARATPERVVITSVATDPPQWDPSFKTPTMVVSTAGNSAEQPEARKILEGIVIVGHAVDHQDLATLLSALHASRLFASIDLKQAKREKFLDQDAVTFELQCHW
jgi:Tfp pilus assembly protein PilN